MLFLNRETVGQPLGAGMIGDRMMMKGAFTDTFVYRRS